MKKIFFVMAVLAVIFLASLVEATDEKETRVIEFSYEFGKRGDENNFSTTNMKAVYDLSMFGLGKAIDDSSWYQRFGKVIIASVLKRQISYIAHEYKHVEAQTTNCGGDCDINWWFWEGQKAWYCYDGSGWENRTDTAGLASDYRWTDSILRERLGKTIEIQDFISFIDSQYFQPNYIFGTPSNLRTDPNGDISRWVRHQSPYQPIQERLMTDLKYAAAWQILGTALPLYGSAVYFISGRKMQMPRLWLNPVGELTDAGVIYRLDAYALIADMFMKVSVGMGWDRARGDALISMSEAEISKPLYENDWKLTLRAGVSKTLENNYNLGLGLEKKLPWIKNVSATASVNHFSGYHIENLKQRGTQTANPQSDSNTIAAIGLKFQF